MNRLFRLAFSHLGLVCSAIGVMTRRAAICALLPAGAFGAALSPVLTRPAAAEDLALRDAASMAGVAMFLNARAPGLVLAVVRGQDSIVAGYGETAPGSGKEPDGRSIVRIGSVSKVFAGDVLARMAASGELSSMLRSPATHRPARRPCPSPTGRSRSSTSRPIRPACPGNWPIRPHCRTRRTLLPDSRRATIGTGSRAILPPIGPAPPRSTRISGSACWARRWRKQAASPMRTSSAAASLRRSVCRTPALPCPRHRSRG